MTGFNRPWFVDDTILDGTAGEAFRRGPELHGENLLWQVVAGARRSADAAVLQVYAAFRHGWTGFQILRPTESLTACSLFITFLLKLMTHQSSMALERRWHI